MRRAGSHTVLSLLEHGFRVTIIDNLDNAFEEAFERMKKLAGERAQQMKFIKVPTVFSKAVLSSCLQATAYICLYFMHKAVLYALVSAKGCCPVLSHLHMLAGGCRRTSGTLTKLTGHLLQKSEALVHVLKQSGVN